VHEAQVYNVVIANLMSQTAGEWYRCLFGTSYWRLKDNVEGVEVFDAHHQQNFKLRVILLWTINDFLAYENLSG